MRKVLSLLSKRNETEERGTWRFLFQRISKTLDFESVLSGYLICWCEFLLSGWAPFCYMNREIRAVMSSSLRRCHARHLHCRRDGYENHVNCMRMSRGGCLDPIKLACREGLKFCHMAKNETTDIIRLVQEVSAELFQIRKWGHKCTVFGTN